MESAFRFIVETKTKVTVKANQRKGKCNKEPMRTQSQNGQTA